MHLIVSNGKVVGIITSGMPPEEFHQHNPGQQMIADSFGVSSPLGYTYDGSTIFKGPDYVDPANPTEVSTPS